MSETILPGATLGMLGSGQLGRMFAIAARRLGYRVHVFSPAGNTPTGEVADREVVGEYLDTEAVAAFARDVDVVSYEFENVPAATVDAVEACGVPVLPGRNVLHVSQNRIREKTFLRDHGFPVADFARIESGEDLRLCSADLYPGILKTTEFGYDGKGQASVVDAGAADAAREQFAVECILEKRIDFQLELSVVAARSALGETKCFGPMENLHARHILDVSLCPARVSDEVCGRAVELATGIMDALRVVGVLCVEMFLTNDGELLVNELAPRPHNSGHLTIDAHRTCQFEQQVRAVCGLPLGDVTLRQPAAMANILGDLWCDEAQKVVREPDWAQCLAEPSVKLHLYGKSEAKYGRKMGHLTATASTIEEAERHVIAARNQLGGHVG